MTHHVLEQGFRKISSQLLRSHPDEVRQGTRFQEEARSERLANVIRFCLVLVWTATSLWGEDNDPLHILFNLIAGGGSMLMACGVHVWLSHRPYSPVFKYITTTFDMCLVVGLMIAYAVAEGPVFMFKMPIFVNILCALGLAAFRFSSSLVVYGTTLAVGSLACLWWWLHAFVGIEYGSRHQHAYGSRLNGYYLSDIILYLAMFGFLTAVLVLNLRRHMKLRVAEAGRAAREEERGLMAMELAHEIRNPLAGISGFAQLIREAGRADRRHVDAILDDAHRLHAIVEGFLRYSRPFLVKPAEVDLVSLLFEFCQRQSACHPDPVLFETGSRELMIRTDAVAITQIILNFVRNAYHVQPAGLPIRVILEGDCRKACIRVEDAGPGVNPDLLSKLFLPFQTGGGKGTGLGLAIARKMARALGGDVMYEPRNRGACFMLSINAMSGEGDA